jgi:hypothetical protein
MSHPYQDAFYETIEDLLNKVKIDCDDKSPLTEQNNPQIIVENLEEYFKHVLKRVVQIKNRYRL